MQEKIRTIFTESIQTQIAAVESLTPDIAIAVERIVNALINGNRILCCGSGSATAIAEVFVTHLVHQYDMQRPSLPAISLSTNNVLASRLQLDNEQDEFFAKQVKVLGHNNDILVVLSANGYCQSVIKAIEAAVTKDMMIIALTGYDGGEIAGLLGENDVELRIPSDNPARINEIYLLLINLMAQLIDNSLFGFNDD